MIEKAYIYHYKDIKKNNSVTDGDWMKRKRKEYSEAEKEIVRILDPHDTMDYQLISLEEWKIGIKRHFFFIEHLGYSVEQFFECIRKKNLSMGQVQQSKGEEKKCSELQQQKVVTGPNYFDTLPNEVIANCIFYHLPYETLFILNRVCRHWDAMLKDKKLMLATYKQVCQEVWKNQVYLGTKDFFKGFDSWRHMVVQRPRIRYDGIYICQMHYVRLGLSTSSEYRPALDVYSYKYMRFFENGTVIQAYTIQPPKKFAHKFTAKSMDIMQLIGSSEDEEDMAKDLQLIVGTYQVWNDRIVLTQPDIVAKNFEYYRYEGVIHRQYRDPELEEEKATYYHKKTKPQTDYIDITYFGQKMTPDWYRQYYGMEFWQNVEPFHLNKESKNPLLINYKWLNEIKIKNSGPNHFVFHQVDP